MGHEGPVVYESGLAYEAERIHAAAVYCSDGRIGNHVDDFLQQGLGLPRYDRLAIPGGPASLAGHLSAFWQGRGAEEQLRFLVRVHGLTQVVLIAHEGCAFYRDELRVPETDMRRQQEADLEGAARVVRRIGSMEIRAFFAEPAAGRLRFRSVPA